MKKLFFSEGVVGVEGTPYIPLHSLPYSVPYSVAISP